MNVCAVIPSHDHVRVLPDIVRTLRAHGLAVFIVDDGSRADVAAQLAGLHDPQNQIWVQRFDTNRGKGAAVVAAMQTAIAAGFTHAVQIDADGQHDLGALPKFLELAARFPDALICGRPIYDASAPLGRRIGRWITHVWVWIETLSLRIVDSMCGFRLYPLAPCAALFAKGYRATGMEFDTDIIVRLFWAGVAPVWVAVRVAYPPENHSNFAMGRDNWRITCMHTGLFFAMLVRLPVLLLRRPPHPYGTRHWANIPERGLYLGMKVLATLCKWVGNGGRMVLIAPVVAYFFLTGREQRQAAGAFLARALGHPPTLWQRWRHFLNFGMRGVDVLMAWLGKLPGSVLQPVDAAVLAELDQAQTGCVLVVAHVGNVEVVRALVDARLRERVTVLVHTLHAVNFNRIIAENSGSYADNLFQVSEIGPATVIALKQRLEKGHMIVIAGDRTALSAGHSVRVPFFGAPAPFPEGPWILASLLECPVYLMHCPKIGGRYRLGVESFAEKIVLPRKDRRQALEAIVRRYAARLEAHVREVPLQWYNFYRFWGAP